MRFGTKEKPRGVLSSKDLRRLTLLIAGTGAVLIAMQLAGRSDFWAQLFPQSTPRLDSQEGEIAPEGQLRSSDGTEIQANELMNFGGSAQRGTPLRDSVGDSRGGTAPLVGFPGGPGSTNSGGLGTGDLTDPDDASPPSVFPPAGPAGPDLHAGTVDYALPDYVIQSVRDDVLGRQSGEKLVWVDILRRAETIPASVLRAAPRAHFAHFMDAPGSCRGKLWNVEGKLRRLTRVRHSDPTFPFSETYDAWISLPDSGNELVHVVVARADTSLPLSDFLGSDAPEVRLCGYYLKREGYMRSGTDGGGQGATAPMLLATNLYRAPVPPPPPSRADGLTPWLGWMTVAVGIGIFLIFWQFQVSDSVFRGTRTHQLTRLPATVDLEGVEAQSVGDMLAELEQEE